MANNSRNRGQIVEKGKDKWYVKIYRGKDASGKKLYHRKVIHGKKSAAQKYLTAKLREKDLGVFIESSQQLLNEHLDNWLKIIKMRVAEQTYNSYESVLKTHIRDRIGSLRLGNIKLHDVQQVYNEMELQGKSARTIRYAHAVLSMALRKAIELNYIVRNPCEFAVLPKQEKKETKAFSPQQASVFLHHAKNTKLGFVFEFAMVTGMRPEEYLSLKWTDVDLKKGVVYVQRALVWLKGGGYKFTETKTKKSRRSIPLTASFLSKLKKHRRQQLEHRMSLGQAYENLDLIFATEIGTPINYRNLTLRYYDKILESAGLDNKGFVLYSLRHTCATLLLASGENPKVVSERLGHSSVKMTLDTYSHVLPQMQQSASERLDSMLYQKTGKLRKI